MDEQFDPTPPRRSRLRSRLAAAGLTLAILASTAVGGFAGGAAVRYWSEAKPVTASTVPASATQTKTAFAAQAGTAAGVYAAVAPAVVTVSVNTQSPRGSFPTQGEGSGFIVDEQGHILTNNHVVDGANRVSVTLADGTRLSATVTGTDPGSDLAVIQADIPSDKLVIAKLGDSDELAVGDPVVAIGSPFGLEQTMTAGIVSALKRTFGQAAGRPMRNLIQTDAPINPGNSGGPLFNLQGEVVGIATSIESPVRASVGIGFAIPSNTARLLLPSLSEGSSVDHPYMGISGQAITAELARTLQLGVDTGVLIAIVTPGGPAATAGIRGSATTADGSPARGGDVITAIDGNEVRTVEDIANYIDTKRVGDTVTVTVLREGKTLELALKLGAWPRARES